MWQGGRSTTKIAKGGPSTNKHGVLRRPCLRLPEEEVSTKLLFQAGRPVPGLQPPPVLPPVSILSQPRSSCQKCPVSPRQAKSCQHVSGLFLLSCKAFFTVNTKVCPTKPSTHCPKIQRLLSPPPLSPLPKNAKQPKSKCLFSKLPKAQGKKRETSLERHIRDRDRDR